MFAPATLDPKQDKNKETLIEEYETLEFQMFRMQENIKEIAKKWDILGIDQTKEEKWVIVYAADDGNICKIMAHDCETPFLGKWDFSIHAQYKNDHQVHIDDIRGEENRGFGSVCMNFLKEYTKDKNIHTISGDISERDWDHLDRLIHFYKKHRFYVDIEYAEQKGAIHWHP
ncbi:hypothetical protein K8O68_06095 [Salipaludibacillus sp. CUR1]|uniref:hypothetical protein n=1 Tax=Salipaludibacillus sp. CUR1 TaxID=2820003 RepID=UPI001E582113|nr:hypothetical protein [Salipaludibacillus sp. CUR1]MCE7791991.1 hypothetical protein [Salipaludibacillus sp. CUR1]